MAGPNETPRKKIPIASDPVLVDNPSFNLQIVTCETFQKERPDAYRMVVESLCYKRPKASIAKQYKVALATIRAVELTEERGGVWLSVNGIPYFKLNTNKYSRKLNMTDDFVRFVVECDDVRLNLSRNDFSYNEAYDAFEDALVAPWPEGF